MKLDKIKFAKVVAFISNGFGVDDIQTLDDMIDIDVEPVSTGFVDTARVDELLKHNNRVGGFIDAIKAYRALTGAGLKESKDAIERYRVQIMPTTLGDILKQAEKQ